MGTDACWDKLERGGLGEMGERGAKCDHYLDRVSLHFFQNVPNQRKWGKCVNSMDKLVLEKDWMMKDCLENLFTCTWAL